MTSDRSKSGEDQPPPPPQKNRSQMLPLRRGASGINPFQRQGKGKAASPKSAPRVSTPPTEAPRDPTPKENTPQPGDDNFVNMADWIRDESRHARTGWLQRKIPT